MVAPLLLALLILMGCAGARTNLMQQVRTNLAESNFQGAYQVYQAKVKTTQKVDELLNLGLLALEAGDYATAQRALADADVLAEERLTKSLSREAAGVALSDRVRAYQGTTMDKALVHYYRALAFLSEHNLGSAVVEGRRIASYLEVTARESKHTYKDDAYLQWFSGALYDGNGEHNDAWISYKRARELYKDFYGVPQPSYLCPVTLTAAQRLGHTASIEEIEKVCPDARPIPPGYGRVVVIAEAGVAPPILERNLVFPIYEDDDTDWSDAEERDRYAWEVSRREGYHDDGFSGGRKLKYVLRVATPYYADGYPGTRTARVAVREESGDERPAEFAQNVGAMLQQDLRDRYPAILARSITRALIKFAAKEAAEKAGNKEDKVLGAILGVAMNAAAVATEAADTRSWETLPDRIFVADFAVEPGPHALRAVFEDGTGNILYRHDFPLVDVKPGEVVFLRVRNTQ